MKDGYIRVAAGSFETSIANVKNNSENICNLINEAYHNDARVLVLPELCLTGYTCEDLFNQDRLLNEAKQQLQTIITATNNKDLITIVGLPYQHLNSLYNVAAVIHQGALLALVPKTHIPNYQEFYEARRFEQALKETLMVKRYLLELTMFLLQQLIQILNLELKFVKIFGYQMPQVLNWL